MITFPHLKDGGTDQVLVNFGEMTLSQHFKHYCLNCECGNLEHQIWFRYFSDESIKNRELYVEMHYPNVSFWNRLKIAIKYIFNPKNGQFTDIVVNQNQVSNLQNFIDDYRNNPPIA